MDYSGDNATFRTVQVENLEAASCDGASRDSEGRYSELLVSADAVPRVGGSGSVVAAYDAFGRKLALKTLVLPARAEGQPADDYERLCERRRASFREEFSLLSRLAAFRQFPDAYGFGEVGGAPAILMEWIEGPSLEELLQARAHRGGPRGFDAYDVALAGRSLFHVLGILERFGDGFVHRDLSPANVVVRTSLSSLEGQREGKMLDLCLIDFGSSLLGASPEGTLGATASSLRGTTPEYAPPEMLSDDLPDAEALRNSPKVDVYAACSILYEMLRGDTPFRIYAAGGCDPASVKARGVSPAADGPTRRADDALLAVIARGLEARQEDRPAADDMRQVFARFLEAYSWCGMGAGDDEFPGEVDPQTFFPPGAVSAGGARGGGAFDKELGDALNLRMAGDAQRDDDQASAGRFGRWFQRHFAGGMAVAFVAYTLAVLYLGYSAHELLG